MADSTLEEQDKLAKARTMFKADSKAGLKHGAPLQTLR